MRISGNGEKECWRFLEKHGIYRPGSATRINWFKYRFEEVQEYAAEHGIKAAAQKYKIPVKSISNAFYRRERTGLARDALSLRDVCIYLQYRPKEVLEWVAEGRLEAEKQVGKNGYIVYHFQLDTLKRFCEQNPSLLKRRRWPKQRFEFLEKIVFAPKHAELIDGC